MINGIGIIWMDSSGEYVTAVLDAAARFRERKNILPTHVTLWTDAPELAVKVIESMGFTVTRSPYILKDHYYVGVQL